MSNLDYVEARKKTQAYIEKYQRTQPLISELSRMEHECQNECPDGCVTDPDGVCEHGLLTWLSYLGYA